MSTIPFIIAHNDHGISEEQANYIHDQVMSSEPDGFFIKEVVLPPVYGTIENSLYGPEEGDEPVSEEEVVYLKRGERMYSDRMVRWPKRQTDRCQAIGIVKYDEETSQTHVVYFTIYGGALAPQHPEDPNNRDIEGSKEFWSKHALAL